MFRYFGCSWYPEHRPEHEDEAEIVRMSQTGFNMVRLGEFSWDRLEPREGEFDFRRLHTVLDRLHARGIRALLCTPTAAPPPWMQRKYPEIRRHKADGSLPPEDDRRNYCHNSGMYRDRIAVMLRAFASEFSTHPAVEGWQIDNELGCPACYCAGCQKKFRQEIAAEFGDVENFNQKLWRGFWSSRITDWNELSAPFAQSAGELAWNRFQSRSWAEFIAIQAQILRSCNPRWTVTTNSWLGPGHPVEPPTVFAPLDTVGYDCYCNYFEPYPVYRMTWDYYRTLKPGKPFRILETGTWNQHGHWPESLQALRVWAWSMFAHGADTVLYFPWRQSPMGEEDHPALLPWEGTESAAWRVVSRLGAERRRYAAYRNLPPPAPKVAILFSPVAMLAGGRENRAAFLRSQLTALHDSCTRLGVEADVRSEGPFDGYRAILLAGCEHVSGTTARALRDFVRSGGVVYAEDRVDVMDEFGVYRSAAANPVLDEMFGIRTAGRFRFGALLEYETDFSRAARYRVTIDGNREIEFLERTELLRSETDPVYWNRHDCGAGCAFRIAGVPATESREKLLPEVFAAAGIEYIGPLPPDCEIIRRGNVRFFLNASPRAVTLPRGGAGPEIRLGPYDLAIEDLSSGSLHFEKSAVM